MKNLLKALKLATTIDTCDKDAVIVRCHRDERRKKLERKLEQAKRRGDTASAERIQRELDTL